LKARYRLIDKEAANFPLATLCRVLGVSRSAYYAARQAVAEGEADPLAHRVCTLFGEHARRYGSRRLHTQLQAEGYHVGRHRARSLLREQGLKAIQPRSFAPRTSDSRHTARMSPNLLSGRDFPTRPNEVLIGDITYLPLQGGGWAYLATWLDLYSRYLAGWHVGESLADELVITAMKSVITRRQPPPGLLAHSDRGGQYASNDFRQLLQQQGLVQSMSRAGEVYNNAFAEGLFSRYKAELLEDGQFADVGQARQESFAYIEGYYNRVRAGLPESGGI
jgi:transposase InsO family protein